MGDSLMGHVWIENFGPIDYFDMTRPTRMKNGIEI